MFCQKCGRELRDGEICNCTSAPAQQQYFPGQQQEMRPASALPEGQAVATAIANNPIVEEVINTAKGVMKDPVQQVSVNAGRTDILWLILMIIESALTSFGITTIFRRGFYQFMTDTVGEDISYKEYSEDMAEIGLSVGKIFGFELLWAAATIFVAILLVVVLLALSKKNTAFSPAANMTATAFMPAALLMAAAGIVSFVYAPLGILIGFGAIISVTILGFSGVQRLDRFAVSPFWLYVVCVIVAFIAGTLIQKFCLENIAEELMEELEDAFKYLL